MKLDRRKFFRTVGVGVAACAAKPASAENSAPVEREPCGMLVDTTVCIGCRKCEWACNQTHELSPKRLEEFEDFSVYEKERRMEADSYTVVNRYPNPRDPDKPIHVKVQCMHCLKPACASACLVGAFNIEDSGAVTYDAGKCMGCRYCLVACPFGVPTYEYDNPFNPRVMKCSFCHAEKIKEGKIPACAEICPPMALTFGKRSELLKLAREKIAAHPDKYINHIYGEHEVGGTCWLYLASKEFEELGLLSLGTDPVPALTEAIQHGIFKFGIPPLLLYGLLGAAMWSFRHREEDEQAPARAEVKP